MWSREIWGHSKSKLPVVEDWEFPVIGLEGNDRGCPERLGVCVILRIRE